MVRKLLLFPQLTNGEKYRFLNNKLFVYINHGNRLMRCKIYPIGEAIITCLSVLFLLLFQDVKGFKSYHV